MAKEELKTFKEFEEHLEKEYIKWESKRIKRKQTKLGEGYLMFHMPDEFFEIALKYLRLGRELTLAETKEKKR